MRFGMILAGVGAAALVAGVAAAADRKADEPGLDYARDVITVAVPERHSPYPTGRTANCIVWANAEGLGVGPAELGGLHGLVMNLNPHPLADEAGQTPITFAMGMTLMKAQFPTAPAWLVRTLEKNQAAIEAACGQDHETPVKVHAVTARDKAG